jgi:Ca-activated chloride channel family protein
MFLVSYSNLDRRYNEVIKINAHLLTYINNLDEQTVQSEADESSSQPDDSKDADAKDEESKNEESKNEDSKNEESKNEDSKNEESKNEDSKNEESKSNKESDCDSNAEQDRKVSTPEIIEEPIEDENKFTKTLNSLLGIHS